MKITTAPSHSIHIWMAGPLEQAEQVCREYCYETGFCVTVTPTRYIYTGGEETGFVVGLINYPRFPSEPAAILVRAHELGERLMERLCQSSFTIETPEQTRWVSRRAT